MEAARTPPPILHQSPAAQSASPVAQGVVRQRHRLSPFRRLRLRLRSQLRPRTPLLRRSPKPSQTQNRFHPNLPSPIPRTNPPPSPPRIHQRLRHQHLARHHPHLPRTLLRSFCRSHVAQSPIASSDFGLRPRPYGDAIGYISRFRAEVTLTWSKAACTCFCLSCFCLYCRGVASARPGRRPHLALILI
jgi:hypothetical protein